MLKKIAIVGGIVAVAALGVGGAAWAESNSSAPQAVTASAPGDSAVPAVAAVTTPVAPASAAPTTGAGKNGAGKNRSGKNRAAGTGAAKGAKRDRLALALAKVSHAQWVSKDGKTGTFVTHDEIAGTVSAVTPTSIVVKAADGTSETFAISSTTKVHVKGNAKGTAGTIAQVKVGDTAIVLGTGAGAMTATQVIDRGIPRAATTTGTTTAPTTS